MTSYKAGFINSLTLAAFAVIAVVATAVLVSNPKSSNSVSTQAQVARRNVKLVQNSITPYALKDTNGTPIKNKLGLTGQICFGSQLRTGSEQWTLWATSDTGGRRYLKERGSSAHVHHGHFDTAPGYPGPCSVVNRDTGEAILENLGPLQNNTFNLVLTFPQDLKQGEYCPDLYLHYRSNRQGGLAFAKVSLSDITTASGNPVCSPGNVEEPTPEASTPGPGEPGVTFIPVSTRPTRRASVNPTREPLEPTAEPTPSSPAITGRISVYSCKKPSYTQLTHCENQDDSNSCTGLPYNQNDEKTPVEHGVWLADDNRDNTWIYQYRISRDLNRGDTVLLGNKHHSPAFARIDGKDYIAEPENLDKLRVRVPAVRDFEIQATNTCGDKFHAITYIKDTDGNRISTFDNQPSKYGAINDKRRTQRNNFMDPNFYFGHNGKSGAIEVGPVDLNTEDPLGYGKDGLATVRLIIPDNWKVVEQRCRSYGKLEGCPSGTDDDGIWSKTVFTDGEDPRELAGLRVANGVDIEYGWILEEGPAPAPPVQEGNGDMEVRVTALNWPEVTDQLSSSHIGSKEPNSCERLQTPENPDAQERPLYLMSFEVTAKCVTCGGNVEFTEEAEKFKGHLSFHDIPAGEYELSITRPDRRGFDVWPGCSNKRWTVRADGTVANNRTHTRAVIILQNRDGEEYKHEGTERVCREKSGQPNRLLGVRDIYCYYPQGEQERVEPGSGNNAGQCWPPNERRCTGTAPDNPRYANNPQARCNDAGLGSAIGWCGPSNNACCSTTRSGGGSGGGGGQTPLPPGQPGGGGSGGSGGGLSCSEPYDDILACLDNCSDATACQNVGGTLQYRCCDGSSGGGNRGGDTTDVCRSSLGTSFQRARNPDGSFAQSSAEARSACTGNKYQGYTELKKQRITPGKGTFGPEIGTGVWCCKLKDEPGGGGSGGGGQPKQCPAGYTGPVQNSEECPDPNKTLTLRGVGTCCLESNSDQPQTDKITVEPSLNNDTDYTLRILLYLCDKPGISLNCEKKEFQLEARNKDRNEKNKPIVFTNLDKYAGLQPTLKCVATIVVPYGRDVNNTCDKLSVSPGNRIDLRVSASQSSFKYNLSANLILITQTLKDKNAQETILSSLDLDGNGFINTIDYQLAIDNFGLSLQTVNEGSLDGDVNEDGVVNALDISYYYNNFGEEVK